MATEYKLKGLTSVDLKNGQKQEVEVDGIEGGKILLAKVKDQVHAMSANCTHYGAPLVKGVLTGEGSITCPWHGGMSNNSLFFTLRSILTQPCSLLQGLHR
jgi:nitrite reductase/ring-hydroxylating ferredoxin subunit